MANKPIFDDELDYDLDIEQAEEPKAKQSAESESEDEHQGLDAVEQKPAEEDFEVEVAQDELYSKEPWKIDPQTAEVSDDEKAQYGPKVQKRIGKLSAALKEEGRQKARATRERDEAISLIKQLQQEKQDLQNRLGHGTIAYTKMEVDKEETHANALQKQLQHAYAYEGPEEQARLQSELAAAHARRVSAAQRAEQERLQWEAYQRQQQQLAQQQQAPVYQQPSVDTTNFDSWKTKNTWFQEPGNEDLTDMALVIAQRVVESGVSEGSHAYFEAIDRNMKQRFPQRFGVRQPAPRTSVAPSARQSQQTSSPIKGKIVLKPEQEAVCKLLGISPKEFIKQKREDERRIASR